MKRIYPLIFLWIAIVITIQNVHAQDKTRSKLIWEVNKVDLGIVLEEQGNQEFVFDFIYTQDSVFKIQKVWTDCGCTTVDYTKKSLQGGDPGFVKVSFDPSSVVGFFSKMIVVQGNIDGSQDTLFVFGTAVPFPENPNFSYPIKKSDIGFRLSKINMGSVFTNEPKLKQVEFYNFSNVILNKNDFKFQGPLHLKINQIQEEVRPQERGILEISYDGNTKGEVGFSMDQLAISWSVNQKKVDLEILANIFEYFPPFPKENLNVVPQLWIENKEINLGSIPSNQIQTKVVNLINKGQEVLEINKVQGNCQCLEIEVSKNSIAPGESAEFRIVFDPKGRFGIDQRNIYFFSNDPVNPIQLVILKTSIR